MCCNWRFCPKKMIVFQYADFNIRYCIIIQTIITGFSKLLSTVNIVIYRVAINHITLIFHFHHTGFSKSVSNVHIIIRRIQDVFQQLSNGVIASKWSFNFNTWFSAHNKELPNSVVLKIMLNKLKIIFMEMKYQIDVNEHVARGK